MTRTCLRRRLIIGCSLAFAATFPALAQTYPDKTLTLVVGFPPVPSF